MIDTRSKRASVLGVGRPWMRSKEPDAIKGTFWRAATGNVYNGNFPPVVTFPISGFGKRAEGPIRGLRAAAPIRGMRAESPIRGLPAEEPIRGRRAEGPIRGLRAEEFE